MDYFERVKCKVCKENYGSETNGWICNSCFKKRMTKLFKILQMLLKKRRNKN